MQLTDSFPGSFSGSQVRTWCGDMVDLPAFQGPADVVVKSNAAHTSLQHRQRHSWVRALAVLLRLQVRAWCGDIVDLPAFQGPADAVFFNAVLGNVHDQHAALWAGCRQLRPGGCVVLSHPLGRRVHDELRLPIS